MRLVFITGCCPLIALAVGRGKTRPGAPQRPNRSGGRTNHHTITRGGAVPVPAPFSLSMRRGRKAPPVQLGMQRAVAPAGCTSQAIPRGSSSGCDHGPTGHPWRTRTRTECARIPRRGFAWNRSASWRIRNPGTWVDFGSARAPQGTHFSNVAMARVVAARQADCQARVGRPLATQGPARPCRRPRPS